MLEIGTGCGYQAALLARLAQEVYSVERISALLMKARALYAHLGFREAYSYWYRVSP